MHRRQKRRGVDVISSRPARPAYHTGLIVSRCPVLDPELPRAGCSLVSMLFPDPRDGSVTFKAHREEVMSGAHGVGRRQRERGPQRAMGPSGVLRCSRLRGWALSVK